MSTFLILYNLSVHGSVEQGHEKGKWFASAWNSGFSVDRSDKRRSFKAQMEKP